MNISPEKDKQIEALLWAIALPGFGQLRNGYIAKGLIFIVLEFVVNVESNLNTAIAFSFHGKTAEALAESHLNWLMFYPCIYLYAIWDAYTDAGGGSTPLAYLPFVLAAYLGTVGVIYSPTFDLAGVILGPVWLPILTLIIGAGLGVFIQTVVLKNHETH
jgi:hypothetical protein